MCAQGEGALSDKGGAGATQARYYSDRSSRRRELGAVGGGAESFIQLGRQR